MSLLRTFVALPVGDEMSRRIAETVAGLRGRLAGLRWVSDASVHLTLRFLGPSSAASLERLEGLLRQAAAGCPPIQAFFSGLGVFPERGSPRVLWLGVTLPPAALALQAACESAAVSVGFPRETRAYRPHLTLARWRAQAPRPQLPAVDLGAARLVELVLFRSDLKPTGAEHSPLAAFPLVDSGL